MQNGNCLQKLSPPFHISSSDFLFSSLADFFVSYDALLKSFLKNKKCLFDRAQSKVVKSKKSSGRRESFRSEAVVKKMMKSTSKKCAFFKSFLWKGGSSGREQYGVDDNRASREKCAKERERET